MRQVSFARSIRVAAVLVAFAAGRAFGGFTDTTRAAEMPVTQTENPIASSRDTVANDALSFEVNINATEKRTSDTGKLIQRAMPNTQEPEPAVTAPLPDALLPGLAMITATFVATRVFKRRLI